MRYNQAETDTAIRLNKELLRRIKMLETLVKIQDETIRKYEKNAS